MERYFVRFTYKWQRKGITSVTMESETSTIISVEWVCDVDDIVYLKKILLQDIEKRKLDIHNILYVKDILNVNKL